MAVDDLIGVVREHKRASVEVQRHALQADGFRRIIELGSRKDCYSREQLQGILRDGTTLGAMWAFLLAAPGKSRERGGVLADWHTWTERICKGRKVRIKDVDTGTIAETPGQRRAMYALVKLQLARTASALNGKRVRGRKRYYPTDDELRRAKMVWRDVIEYPTWKLARGALLAINRDFFPARAHKLWGPREAKRK